MDVLRFTINEARQKIRDIRDNHITLAKCTVYFDQEDDNKPLQINKILVFRPHEFSRGDTHDKFLKEHEHSLMVFNLINGNTEL